MNPRRRQATLALMACLVFLIAAAPGLNALSDEPLRDELANDGLSTLLERAFVVDKVPEDQRAPQRAIIALQGLLDPKLSGQEKAVRIRQVVAGIESVLPRITDPQLLLTAGAILVKQGVEQDVNTLEYFGEDSADATKARLSPTVNAAVALYDRAAKILDQQQAALQDKIVRPGDEAALAWQKISQQFQTASYTRWMLSYSQALAMDRADKNRALIAQQGIDNLEQWDTPDSGVQPIVMLQIAKLKLMKGAHVDFVQARDILARLTLPGVNPPPDRFTRFNAEYFHAVSFILDQKPDDADRDAAVADKDRRAFLRGVTGDEYAMDMLHYRIALARQDNLAAVRILETLSEKAPGLRTVIADQLLDKIPAHPDLATLSPLILSAIMQRAWIETPKPAPDRDVLQQGLAAAKQYLIRADKADALTTQQGTIDASKLRGVILKVLNKPAEAAAAFLDHAERFKDDPTAQAGDALNEAIGQIALLLKTDSESSHQSDVTALEDRLLPLAVDSFRRYDLAYDYARHLQRNGHLAKAAAVFDLVPTDDPNAFNAQFFKLIALGQRLEARKTDTANAVLPRDLPAVIRQMRSLADRVIQSSAKQESSAKTPAQTRQFRSMQVRTILLAADVEQRYAHNPKRAMALLDGFEKKVAQLPDSAALIAEALNLRVAADMSAGDTAAATAALVEYLNRVGGDEGLQTVYNLLTQLNAELDRATQQQDTARVRELTDDRAQLTPFLVKWAESNPNPDIKKYTYRYRVFDAATQKQSAELQTDPALRTARLTEAMSRFNDLQSPENVALYEASLPADAPPDLRDYPDPAVTLGIGNVAFALGDWKLAHDSIGQLLADSRLGDGTIVIKNAAGQDETTDNDQFWEAQYKFIYATAQLSHDTSSGVDPQTAAIILGRLKAIWQDRLGGANWHDKFEELSKQITFAATTQPN